MKSIFSFKSLIIAAIVVLLVGCGNSHRCHIKSGNVVPVEVARFDSVIPQYVASEDTAVLHSIMRDAGRFWGIYNYHLLMLSDMPYFKQGLAAFLNDSVVSQLYADSQHAFADMSQEENELAVVAARFRQLFPDQPNPQFQAHISAMRVPVITVDSLVSISIDTYLGDHYEGYRGRYNNYELRYHNRDRLIIDVAEVLLRNAVVHPGGKTLLDDMVYEGRILYLLSGLLGDDDPMKLFAYSDEELEWCEKNETRVWKKMIEQGDLFTTDAMTKNKYINPAPFTAPLSQNAPARIGRWVGYRIVQQYIERNNITPEQIAHDSIYHVEILRLSGYNNR